MRILVAPVLVGDRICRIVAPLASLLEVEEWVGEWWEPSTVTLTTVSQAPAAPSAMLDARGVPESDRITTDPRAGDADIQALLRPLESESIARIEDAHSPRPGNARKRRYTGNARFRRARVETPSQPDDRVGGRRAPRDDAWTGPFRRADDRLPSVRQDPSSTAPKDRPTS